MPSPKDLQVICKLLLVNSMLNNSSVLANFEGVGVRPSAALSLCKKTDFFSCEKVSRGEIKKSPMQLTSRGVLQQLYPAEGSGFVPHHA